MIVFLVRLIIIPAVILLAIIGLLAIITFFGLAKNRAKIAKVDSIADEIIAGREIKGADDAT
jgi:hypothetical protein